MKPPKELEWILDSAPTPEYLELKAIYLRDKDKRLPSTRMKI